MSLYLCECGNLTVQTDMRVHGLRCSKCPAPVTERWWFRLDEWLHRNVQPRGRLGYWLHRPFCAWVERKLWGPADADSTEGGDT